MAAIQTGKRAHYCASRSTLFKRKRFLLGFLLLFSRQAVQSAQVLALLVPHWSSFQPDALLSNASSMRELNCVLLIVSSLVLVTLPYSVLSISKWTKRHHQSLYKKHGKEIGASSVEQIPFSLESFQTPVGV